MTFREDAQWVLVAPTSIGIRITPMNRQPAHTARQWEMQATSAESNVLGVAASLGMGTKVLTAFVKDSPIARFIQDELSRRHIAYEGPQVEAGGPWRYRHQFNICRARLGGVGRAAERRAADPLCARKPVDRAAVAEPNGLPDRAARGAGPDRLHHADRKRELSRPASRGSGPRERDAEPPLRALHHSIDQHCPAFAVERRPTAT